MNMNIFSVNKNSTERKKTMTNFFDNSENDKNTGDDLYQAMKLLADTRMSINHDTKDNVEVCDSVSAAMLKYK